MSERGRGVGGARHPGESRGLIETAATSCPEVPAFAGMTADSMTVMA
jgi:hypothetical protein